MQNPVRVFVSLALVACCLLATRATAADAASAALPPTTPAAVAPPAAAAAASPAGPTPGVTAEHAKQLVADLVERFNTLEDERQKLVQRLTSIQAQQAELRGGIAALTGGFAAQLNAQAGDQPPAPGMPKGGVP